MSSETHYHTDISTGARQGSNDTMNSNLLVHLLSSTFTVTDIFRQVFLLGDFLEYVDFNKSSRNDLVQTLLEHYRLTEDYKTAEVIAKWGNDVLQPLLEEDAHDVIKALKEEIGALPRIVLYVPSVLSAEALADIGRWCRKEIRGNILMDLHVDPNASGGCMFVWDNKLHDFSLQYFIEKNKEAFNNLITAYIPSHENLVV